MKVAVFALSDTAASRILDALRDDERFSAMRLRTATRVDSFDVLVADGLDPEELALEGPPVVLIEADPAAEPPSGRVHALLPPDFTAEELSACVVAAALELTVLNASQARSWLRRRSPGTRDLTVESLTPRELEVLRMMADGLGNKEVAARLGISDHTAKFHVAQVLAKLRAASRAEAVAMGIRRGLVPL